jgi:hypothetical protein
VEPKETALLHFLATDIFSNFLRALVTENQTVLKSEFENFTSWEKYFRPIKDYLLKSEVCTSEVDAKLAILPALLALGGEQEVVLD